MAGSGGRRWPQCTMISSPARGWAPGALDSELDCWWRWWWQRGRRGPHGGESHDHDAQTSPDETERAGTARPSITTHEHALLLGLETDADSDRGRAGLSRGEFVLSSSGTGHRCTLPACPTRRTPGGCRRAPMPELRRRCAAIVSTRPDGRRELGVRQAPRRPARPRPKTYAAWAVPRPVQTPGKPRA